LTQISSNGFSFSFLAGFSWVAPLQRRLGLVLVWALRAAGGLRGVGCCLEFTDLGESGKSTWGFSCSFPYLIFQHRKKKKRLKYTVLTSLCGGQDKGRKYE
jgi:hypothetical protein